MFTRRRRYMTALAAVLALTIAACGGDDDDGGGASEGGEGAVEEGTLTVWYMTGEVPDEMQQQLADEFEAAHEGVTVDFQEQQWDQIQTRTITALGTNSPPDVIEFGNTFTATFSQALMDLTDRADELGQADWFPGPAASAKVDGSVWAVPYLISARVALYRTDMFQQAGAEVPTSLEEFGSAMEDLRTEFGGNENYGPFYMPGRYWHGMIPFVWDAGGEIAVQEGGEWDAQLSSDESREGLQNLLDLTEKYSNAPVDADEAEPFAPNSLGDGTASVVIETPTKVNQVLENFAGQLTGDQLGAFVMPGTDGPMPQLVGGSNIGVSAGTDMPNAAFEFLKLWTSEKYESIMAQTLDFLPNTPAAAEVHTGNPLVQPAVEALANSKFVPVSPNWAEVEGQNVMHDMFQAILSGNESIEDATEAADSRIEDILNG